MGEGGAGGVRVGVDGCRGGWFAAALSDEGCWTLALAPTFGEVLETWPQPECLLVDIPIGLPPGAAPRRCDVEARRRLGPGRGSSVFPAPPRAVLEAETWEEALVRARAASGRGISLQAWHLVPKIREVDGLLRDRPELRTRIREAHPELLFQSLAEGVPVQAAKRSPEGFARRLALLEARVPGVGDAVAEALARWPRRLLARDDILDALAAAWVAWVAGPGTIAPAPPLDVLPAHPGPQDVDAMGLVMEIVAGVRRNPPDRAAVDA